MAALRITDSSPEILPEYIEHLYSVYPFNRFEYQIAVLLANKLISLDEYYTMREEYGRRNKYMYVYEITTPRDFGEKWAQQHLNEMVPELERPSKKSDPSYNGEYDFWYKGLRIEVKASRAAERGSKEPLPERALTSESSLAFSMNFQQLKPHCCDVFVWIGVWLDKIRYWVLSKADVLANPHFSKGQHRGNQGEGQLWIKESNLSEFSSFEVQHSQLLQSIIKKGKQ